MCYIKKKKKKEKTHKEQKVTTHIPKAYIQEGLGRCDWDSKLDLLT